MKTEKTIKDKEVDYNKELSKGLYQLVRAFLYIILIGIIIGIVIYGFKLLQLIWKLLI